MSATTSAISGPDFIRRKIALRILPLVFVLYIIASLDRANVAYAKINMMADQGFSEAVFGFGAGIFFVGYLLFEIPGAIIVERWSARRWMARILLTWGVCAIVCGFVKTASQFYTARFFLGLAEGGFFPGIIVYLTHWFRAPDRARAISGFVLAVPISLSLGAPLSALIIRLTWFGLAGWRWVFILEGLPAILFGGEDAGRSSQRGQAPHRRPLIVAMKRYDAIIIGTGQQALRCRRAGLAGRHHWLNGGLRAPDGVQSRFLSPAVSLVWGMVVSGVLLTRSPAMRPGW